MSKPATIVSWVAQLAAAAILGMAGVMKWISAPDSIRLFEELGVEPWGRYLMGTAELVTTLLLLVPRTAVWGGVAAMALMAGAIGVHVFRIGMVYNGDASLFIMAMVTFIAGLVVFLIRRGERGAAVRDV
jgi:uncharacterized membrane protein YphA (DoxX/SURF4 family)